MIPIIYVSRVNGKRRRTMKMKPSILSLFTRSKKLPPKDFEINVESQKSLMHVRVRIYIQDRLTGRYESGVVAIL